VTRDTGVGDPRKATTEKGARYFSAVTAKVAAFFVQVAKTGQTDFYV
jgi:creatinine amidohydrolase